MEELVLIKQDSLAKEKFSRNEVQKDVHIVAKNLPFTMEVGSATINLSGARLYAKLHYDSDVDTDYKCVDFVKQEPMTYKVFVDSSNTKATLEFRVAVLTSQHEDSLFRIKIGALVNDMPVEVWSEPIRVVSKPSQVNKVKRGRGSASASTVATPSISSAPPTPSRSSPPSSPGSSFSAPKKTTTSDVGVLEALKRLEEQQMEQRKLIENLVSGQKRRCDDEEEMDVGTAFKHFLRAYSKANSEHRPGKLRKMLAHISSEDQQSLSEFIQVVSESSPGMPSPTAAPVNLSLSGLLMENNSQDWDQMISNWSSSDTDSL